MQAGFDLPLCRCRVLIEEHLGVFTFEDTRVCSSSDGPVGEVALLFVLAEKPLSQSVLLAHRVLGFLALGLLPSVSEAALSVPAAQRRLRHQTQLSASLKGCN